MKKYGKTGLRKKRKICVLCASLCAIGVSLVVLMGFIGVFSNFLNTCNDSVFFKTMFIFYMILFFVGGSLEVWFDKKLWGLFFKTRVKKNA